MYNANYYLLANLILLCTPRLAKTQPLPFNLEMKIPIQQS